MMYKCNSLVVAENVINLATQYMNSQEGVGLCCYGLGSDFRTIIESYQNGREQGFIAWPTFASEIAFFVCLHRNSDRICIYKGGYAMQSISEDAYNHPNMFDLSGDAAAWLVQEIASLYRSKKNLQPTRTP